MVNIDVDCTGCDHRFPREVAHLESPVPCPRCGSIERRIRIAAEEKVEIHDKITIKDKDLTLPRKKSVRGEYEYGSDFSEKHKKFLDKTRIIDRRNDKYKEVVIDLETSKVIHHCEEPLSKHTGHGSAEMKTE